MMAVDDCGATDAQDETELETPIKVSWTGKARSKAWGHFVDFDAEPYTLAARTLERQKTNVVVNTVEEAEALVGALDRYVGGGTTGQTWMNKAMDKAFQRVQAEVRDALSEAETHPRGDDK
nr:hypothetical protein [Haloferax volcanii]